ncbi:MAG TPA: TetR/AcrR family transcriptional regulator [Myxococcales bacterium]|nr:TetR/AcrR family transcriptional regulator [Myxococcales bacterium]
MGSADRRQREKVELREKILATAREMFASEGVEAVTMRKIADRIEYSATAIYQYFPDKDALLREICERDFTALAQQSLRVSREPDPVERLRKLGRAYVEFALAHPSSYRLMFMTPKTAEQELVEGKGVPERDAYALLRSVVQDCIDQGRLDKKSWDAELVSQTLWAGVHGLCALEITMSCDRWVPWRSIKARSRHLLETLLNGILPR